MKLQFLIILLFTLLFTACSNKELLDVEFDKIDKNILFSKDIKPILDKRCVSCHSCYNSPCQLKLDSFEGLDRGATKKEVYAQRLNASEPTRLFIDAQSTKDWREKDFSSVIDNLEDTDESIMMQFLFQKELNPEIKGSYSPETDKLTCVKNKDELENYFEKNPHKAMPYGFPNITKNEYNTIMTWLSLGAKNDTKDKKISSFEKNYILKFEEFLNNPNIKNRVTSRYIYEHLFLAHIYFDETSGNFYELIRSSTKYPEKAKIVPTRFPYDKIDEPFYYRVQIIDSTIVHKTHMVYKIDDEKLKFYNNNFIITPPTNNLNYGIMEYGKNRCKKIITKRVV